MDGSAGVCGPGLDAGPQAIGRRSRPASLAPGAAAFTEIASAMHYTADSPARAAHTDLDTLRTAASAGRLYVTTRSLPELQYDVPRPYADAPRDRIAAYADAANERRASTLVAATSPIRHPDRGGSRPNTWREPHRMLFTLLSCLLIAGAPSAPHCQRAPYASLAARAASGVAKS